MEQGLFRSRLFPRVARGLRGRGAGAPAAVRPCLPSVGLVRSGEHRRGQSGRAVLFAQCVMPGLVPGIQ